MPSSRDVHFRAWLAAFALIGALVSGCKKNISENSEQTMAAISTLADGVCTSGMLETFNKSLAHEGSKMVPFVRAAGETLQAFVESEADAGSHRKVLLWAGQEGDRARGFAGRVVGAAAELCPDALSPLALERLRGFFLGFAMSYASGQR